MILGLIFISIVTELFIGIVYISVKREDNLSADYFRSLNNYVLKVINSGGEVSAEVIDSYDNLNLLFAELGARLKSDAALNPPEFKNETERIAYSADLRENAVLVRANLTDLIDGSFFFIGMLLLLLVFVSLILMLLIFRARSFVKVYEREMLSGFDYLEKALRFESQPGFKKIESRISEVDQLNDMILNLANDVVYNNQLLEKGTFGNLDLLLEDLMLSFGKRMSCDRMALGFIDSSGTLTAETAVMTYKTHYLEPGYRELLSETSLEALIESGKARIINDLPVYAQGRKVSESTHLILKEGIKSSITVPMLFNGKCLGFFFVSSLTRNAYDVEKMNYTIRELNLLNRSFISSFNAGSYLGNFKCICRSDGREG